MRYRWWLGNILLENAIWPPVSIRSGITPVGVKTQVDVPEGFGDGRHNDFMHLQNTGDPAPSASLTSVSAKPFWPFPSTAVTPCGDRTAGGFHVVTSQLRVAPSLQLLSLDVQTSSSHILCVVFQAWPQDGLFPLHRIGHQPPPYWWGCTFTCLVLCHGNRNLLGAQTSSTASYSQVRQEYETKQ